MQLLLKVFKTAVGIPILISCLSLQAQQPGRKPVPSKQNLKAARSLIQVNPILNIDIFRRYAQNKRQRNLLTPKQFNFSTFTRKYNSPGNIWILKNKNFQSHPDAGYDNDYIPRTTAVDIFEKITIDSKYYINNGLLITMYWIRKTICPK